MIKIPKIDHIQFLVVRKFPELALPISPLEKMYNLDVLVDDDEECLIPSEKTKRKAEQYRETLSNLPKSEIKKRYGEELAKQRLEDDQKRYFNQSHADADFDYWSKMEHWTLDEALALSFEKDPKIVNPNNLKNILSCKSPFVQQYEKVKELAERAIKWEKLYNPVLPILFVNWAKETDISFPDELAQKVLARSKNFIDWKKKYGELLEKTNISLKTANQIIEHKNQIIAEHGSPTGVAKPLHTKEQETLLKLISGIAVGQYGYDPKASRSPAAKEISDDLSRVGLSLDPDTVRKWLKQATEHYPPDPEYFKS